MVLAVSCARFIRIPSHGLGLTGNWSQLQSHPKLCSGLTLGVNGKVAGRRFRIATDDSSSAEFASETIDHRIDVVARCGDREILDIRVLPVSLSHREDDPAFVLIVDHVNVRPLGRQVAVRADRFGHFSDV